MTLKKTFFSKRSQKIVQRLRASPPGPVCDTFELHYSLLNTRLPIKTFSLVHFWLKSSPFSKTLVKCQTMPQLLIFHSTISLSHKKFLFRKFLMTSLHVICGLPPPPQSKIPATPMLIFIFFYFLWHFCGRWCCFEGFGWFHQNHHAAFCCISSHVCYSQLKLIPVSIV